jgi:type I restriction enzyme, R subunit
MTATEDATSPNFGFLAKRYPELERFAARSERYFSDDPIVSLITLRQFGEALAQLVAARSGLYTDPKERQRDLLRRLRVDGRSGRGRLVHGGKDSRARRGRRAVNAVQRT